MDFGWLEILFVVLFGLTSQLNAAAIDSADGSISNVAVIGAGISGLCSAKHAIAQGYNVTVFEQTEELGGIWYYTDLVGKDKYGVNIHTAMYQGLRTNVPYHTMEFPDFHYPSNTTTYPPQSDVLKYLQSYADHFDLKRHIKFNHLVIRVLPIENNKWEVIVKNLPANTFETKVFDAVFVCNGHFSTPFIPRIPGAREFKGQMIHSHDYRRAEAFQNETVLVIGGGVSGRDLVIHLSKTANRITFSQHKRQNETHEQRKQRESLFSPKVTLKDNVKRFTPNGAEFIDDSCETFDAVIFATGYNYTFPFLSVDSGIHVDSNFVQPLYKHIFNIEHPTMAFFGITSGIATTKMLDIQVRFALKFLSGAKKLPSKSEMFEDTQIQSQRHWSLGYRKHRSHLLIDDEPEYLLQLAEVGNIEGVPSVFLDIAADSIKTSMFDPLGFRKYKYSAIDDNTFRKERCDES